MRHLILILPLLLTACATTGSSGGGVLVETVSGGQAAPGAKCVVNTNSDNWDIITPATVRVNSINGDLHVVCNKEGYRTSEMIYKPTNGYGSGVGFGIGGGSGVGIGMGLSVPLTVGGGNEYPSRITVQLRPL